MSHFFKLLVLFFCVSFALIACHQSTPNEKKVGIIIPIEHKAMDEIVDGFTQSLRNQSPYYLKFKIMNAQGDLNLQRAIIKQMKNEHYDLIVPIGTSTTQMAVALIHKQPIVSLAALYSEQERKTLPFCNISVVHDEIPSQQLLSFIHEVDPTIKHLTLIHSASDKIFSQVKETIAIGKTLGIEIKTIMVPTLNELYSIAHAIPIKTQGLLILKDNLIASGIATLATVAAKNHLPLITSDQGTVQDGALFSLGVKEREIGDAGANLAAAILSGTPACHFPIVEMSQLTVFINKHSAQNSLIPIQKAARKLNYTVQMVDEKKINV